MSRELGPHLTPMLLDRLRGDDLEAHAGEALLAATVDQGGAPHLALLSYGEVVAANESQLLLATYRGSSTTANLRGAAHIALCLVAEGAAYYIKGSARERPAPPALRGLAVFDIGVTSILEDREGGLPLASGITFMCEGGPEALLNRWRPVVHALRGLSP